MAKERIAYIDFMRGLTMILIVMGHVPDFSIDQIIPGFSLNSYRMPMFFFLSGLFLSTSAGFSDFLRKKVNNLIIPLLFFHFLCSACCYPLINIVHHYRPDIDLGIPPYYAIPSFFSRYWYAAGALWFLVALFMVSILSYLLKKYLNSIGVILAIVAGSVVGWLLMKNKIQLPFYFDIALVALPYFMLGSFVKQRGLLTPSKYDKYGFLALILCLIVCYKCSTSIEFLYQDVPDFFSLYLLPFAFILSVFWFSKILPYVPLVNYIGRYSIIVLGTHQVLISYIWFACIGMLGIHGVTSSVVTFFIVLFFEYFVIRLMVKFFPRFTAQKEFFKQGWKIN